MLHQLRTLATVGITSLGAFARLSAAGTSLQVDVTAAPASRAKLVEDTSRPFDTFNGVAFEFHTGLFEGETSRGRFRTIYGLIAPADASRGSGTVLFEPPHPTGGPVGRELALGREFLFGHGFSYAMVGWSDVGRALLNPAAPGMILGGKPVVPHGLPTPDAIFDEEILIQFAEALTTDSTAIGILGPVERKYAYGASMTAMALLAMQRRIAAAGLKNPFDLTVLHVAGWGGPAKEWMWESLRGDFEPIEAAASCSSSRKPTSS